ncbi:alcohol dehydrogenase [acceptor]-like [Ptychodera flava]|uniref:alcohol dehydrogenase [acceptor]-like n=1 Tax=Ptychodera flava TaxID=63121 RepID=UPI003969BD4B
MADKKQTFDFVIIGAGSAGCVLANRLTEDEGISVLLLEAGPEDTKPEIHIPMAQGFNLGTELDWQYKTVPQKHACFAMKDNRAIWNKGKVLGGSSSINGMQYVRGCKEDYDSWARLGAEGWSYDEVLPYFLKSENNTNEEYLKTEYHNKGGPLTVSDVTPTCKFSQVVMEAAKELGLPVKDVNNGIDQIAFNYFQATIKDGKRCSTAVAFLNPAKMRANLTVWTETLATIIRIVFEEKKATAVEFLKSGENDIVYVNKEVIVSAGSVASPQLLMLSGVGPKAHLEEMGIPVLCDLPVGENMQDHIMIIMRNHGSGGGIAKDCLTTNAIEVAGFIKTKEDIPWPDIQVFYSPFYNFGPNEKEISNYADEFDEALEFTESKEKIAEREGLHFMPGLLHPKSVGDLKLKSRNPLDDPLIDPHYLEDPDDVKTMIGGVRFIQKLTGTKAFRDFGITPTYFKFDNCPYEVDSDQYWEHVVRHLTLTIWHVCGTCKMGAKDDRKAVVDPSLRVRGLDNVRVVDASVMPHITSGNINAPVIMIGEKGADLIKQDLWS